MGASMGGYASWQLAMTRPDWFTAMIPICGGGMYWNSGRLKDVPIWAFHGAKDETVYAQESQKMVDAVNAAGGNARFIIYAENNHDSWSDTYNNYRLFLYSVVMEIRHHFRLSLTRNLQQMRKG